MSAYIDYILLGANDQELQDQMVSGLLRRVLEYVKLRKQYELQAIEIIQDRIDAREGERRAKSIN